MDKLYIIIPAYNEEMNIVSVAKQWHDVVKNINVESKLVILDDGSRDNTYEVLKSLEAYLPQMIVLTKPNVGHGATILFGYHYALDKGADYIFQTDSDGQTLPAEFSQFWGNRDTYSAVIGYRQHRQDGVSRVFVAKILRLVLLGVFGVWVTDANTPFRLMRREILAKYILKVPENFNLANVILTLCFIKYKENIKFVPITFRPRQAGTNSINIKKIVKIGRQALGDFIQIKKNL